MKRFLRYLKGDGRIWVEISITFIVMVGGVLLIDRLIDWMFSWPS